MAALVLIVGFTASRVALLVTSYDANRNWEEPVFLFSATELQAQGISNIFEHQDDLNHGGSVVLLLLAVPWVALVGTSLVTLKGIAILWSGLTLCALMAVAWRYFSPIAAVLLGLFYLLLSPTLARINVTLVGSHPEALLPCTLALGCYLESVQRKNENGSGTVWVTLALALTSGLALWVAYVSATFIVPLLALQLFSMRRKSESIALGIGLLLGVSPWIYQDVWLRPHGAMMWLQHLGGTHAPAEGWLRAFQELAESFGYGGNGGLVLLVICGVAWLVTVVGMWRPGWWLTTREIPPPVRLVPALETLALAPLVLAPVIGIALLAYAVIPLSPNEGYYHYRFFVPLQVSLFWVLAIATEWLVMRFGRAVLVAAVVAVVAAGVWGQAPLYAAGNQYQPDFERDRAEGCMVYGLAEWDRSAAPAAVLQRLHGLAGRCRERAFGGFGWGLANRYIEQRDLQAAQATLAAIDDGGLRWAACGGFWFLLSHASDATMTLPERTDVLRQMAPLCRAPGAQ